MKSSDSYDASFMTYDNFRNGIPAMYDGMCAGSMNYQIPYAVPMLPVYGYDSSEELDKDCEYMKSMYPAAAKQIQREVDEECDKLEYDGSCMFDECPDKVHLGIIVDRIYERMEPREEPSAKAMQFGGRRDMDFDRCQDGRCDHNRRNNPLHDLIEIMLFHEMHDRRRRHRSRKRWF